ncbi:MAG: hypothetical protein M3Q30_15030, partial [Actinomycetota bacterium]|nr:hypothetical protein [Actinomycetota bacterium]
WAGAAGIAFVILIVITITISGSPPMADDAVSKIRDYYVDHRSNLLWANLIGIFATPFVLWFAVVLREMFRGDRLANALGTVSLAGLLVTTPVAMIGGALNVSVIYVDGAAQTYRPDTLRLLYDAQSLVFAATSAGIVAFTLGAALAIRRTGALPSFTMWLALLAVVGNVVAMFTVLDAGAALIGLAGVTTFALFILVTGITMAAGKTNTPPQA